MIAEYAAALRIKGDAARGEGLRPRMQGLPQGRRSRLCLGPDLAGSPSADPAALLANILDPSAVVQPGYLQYLVVDQNGRTYSGVIAAETATSLTLRRGDGAEDTILRARSPRWPAPGCR